MSFRDKSVKLIATFFGIGLLPVMPGTFGSLAGLVIYYFVHSCLPIYVFVTLIIIVLGYLTSGLAEKVFSTNDPKYVVIDEVAGMLLSLIFIPFSLKAVLIGFFVFRLLDTLKPYPISIYQRKHGAVGIMGDDLLAGIMTNIFLQILLVSRVIH